MAQFANQHSFTLIAAVLLLVAASLLLRDGLSWRDALALLALIAGLAAAWFSMRPTAGTASAAALDAARRSGQPALLQFYSPY